MTEEVNLKPDIDSLKEVGFNEYLSKNLYDIGSQQRQMAAQNMAGGRFSDNAIIELGNGLLKIDGKNRRIIISDGQFDRVLIGYGDF